MKLHFDNLTQRNTGGCFVFPTIHLYWLRDNTLSATTTYISLAWLIWSISLEFTTKIKQLMWLTKSNRQYHLCIGILSAVIGTLIGAILVATALEGKDCQADPYNEGIVPWRWNWRRWDWLDFLATVIGGVIGQAVVLGIIFIIKGWV